MNLERSADVRFGAHNGLKSDIAPCSKSARTDYQTVFHFHVPLTSLFLIMTTQIDLSAEAKQRCWVVDENLFLDRVRWCHAI